MENPAFEPCNFGRIFLPLRKIITHRMFLQMPRRNSTVTTDNSTVNSAALRRSPRFLPHNNFQEPQGPKTPKPQSRNNRSRYLDPPLSSKPNVSVKRTRKDCAGNIAVKLGCVSSSTGLRKSPRLHSGVVEGFSNPDASLKKIDKGCTEKVGKDLREHNAELQKCVSFSTGPRKSARLHGGAEGCSSPHASMKKTHKNCVENIGKELKESSDELKKCVKSVTGPRKSSRLSNGVEGPWGVRKSPRFSYQGNAGEHVQMTDLKDGLRQSAILDNEFEVLQGFRRSPRFLSQGDKNNCADKTVDGKCNRFSNSVVIESSKEDALVVVRKDEMGKRETRLRSGHVASAATALAGRDSKRKDINTGSTGNRKRKLGEKGDIGLLSGWTKEQELALQRAYFAASPTPHFWKKVAKLVPGKSAQDCFDKVHSDHLTPLPHRPRSRANRSNSSYQVSVVLSASKILSPAEPKIKRPGCSKQKTHRTQKAMRDLLQKHYEVDQDYEADLFSVLEPTETPSTQTSQQSVMPSTPEHVQGKSIFLQQLHERSSSDHKKPRSGFSSTFGSALVSPPVLKPVKNRALHEKYIDQLHSREARRKMASVQAAKSTLGEEDRKESHVRNMNVISAARNALVCDAREAINQFQYLQANPLSNSCEFDDDDVNVDEDDKGEDGT